MCSAAFLRLDKSLSLLNGHGIRSAVRLQPPGTGSWSFNPGGYFVDYNADGQAISPYSGKQVPKEKAHNPISFFVPGED